MKRHGNLFEKIASFENLLAAEKTALRGKRHRPASDGFHYDLEPNLFMLHDELQSDTYEPGEYRSFWIRDPKKRLISAAPYRLRLHPRKCVVLSVRWGVPFLGWCLYADHRRLRRSSGVRFQRRLAELSEEFGRGEIGLGEIRASVMSWIGHLKHGDTWGLRRRLLGATVFQRSTTK